MRLSETKPLSDQRKEKKTSNKWMTVMICTVGFEGEPVWVGCVGFAVVVGGGEGLPNIE